MNGLFEEVIKVDTFAANIAKLQDELDCDHVLRCAFDASRKSGQKASEILEKCFRELLEGKGVFETKLAEYFRCFQQQKEV